MSDFDPFQEDNKSLSSLTYKDIQVKKTATSIKVPLTNNLPLVAGSPTNGIIQNKISKYTPWESTIQVYDPNTSYNRSFNNDYGESTRAKLVEKMLENKNPHNFNRRIDRVSRVSKVSMSQKPLQMIAESIADDSVRFPKRLSPISLNKNLNLSPDMFTADSHLAGSTTSRFVRRQSNENGQ